MILCLNLAISGGLGWTAWRCVRWQRRIGRANRVLGRWAGILAINIPLFTLKTHRQRLYLLKTYREGQKLVRIGAYLLSLKQWWRR